MITSKQRAALRSYGNNLPDLVYVGKEGITDNLIKMVEDLITARELIKIKVQQNCDLDSREVCDILVAKIGAEPVSVVGNKIVIYRYTTKKGFKHYVID